MFQPLNFQFTNMNRDQKCRWRIPIYFLYFLLSILLILLELGIPIILAVICLPIAYFIHVYSFVMHQRNNKAIRFYLKTNSIPIVTGGASESLAKEIP